MIVKVSLFYIKHEHRLKNVILINNLLLFLISINILLQLFQMFLPHLILLLIHKKIIILVLLIQNNFINL